MSQARFDAGQVPYWQPVGIYQGNQNIDAGPTVLVVLDPTPNLYWRVDWASVVLDYASGLDLSARAGLSLTLSGGPDLEFITVSVWPDTTWLPLTHPFTAMQQLSLPFYVTGLTAIKLVSHSQGGGGASNCNGTVAVSRSWNL